MQSYYCYSTDGMVIGMVTAINGDEAWALAKEFQPEVAYLRPASLVSGPYGQAA